MQVAGGREEIGGTTATVMYTLHTRHPDAKASPDNKRKEIMDVGICKHGIFFTLCFVSLSHRNIGKNEMKRRKRAVNHDEND